MRSTALDLSDQLLAFCLAAVVVICVSVWTGAQAAAVIHTGNTLDLSLADTFDAAVRLAIRPGDPAGAWPGRAAAQLPGPILYWTTTTIAFAMAALVSVFAGLWLRGDQTGTDRADRLGVTPHAKLATRRDLKPLRVPGPTPGRFILGRVGRHLVATEDRTHNQNKRGRVGDRSAVIVVGPSRCGKTANVTAGVTDWHGPAILSSVKDDLYLATVHQRLELGDVCVFDPFHQLTHLPDGVQRVGWSPLLASTTISGAQQAAATLLDAGPTEGVTNANYWSTKGQQLLWPILYAAAINGHTMSDVVSWLTLQDGNRASPSQVGEILQDAANNTGNPTRTEAQLAVNAFNGFWMLDPRTRSDIFSTAQTVITAWEDPHIAQGAAHQPHINLKNLLSGDGANTLYLIQPLRSVERFAVVFGGLLGALLRDEAYELAATNGGSITPTLAVIDEAGNTPIRWLPDVASTCSGIGIQLVTVWQSLAQAKAIYQTQTDALLTNHGTKIFFAGLSDRTTLDYASHLTGNEEVGQTSITNNLSRDGQRKSVSNSTTRLPLVPAELLRRMPVGSALLLHGTLPPAHLIGRRPWEESPRNQRTARPRRSEHLWHSS